MTFRVVDRYEATLTAGLAWGATELFVGSASRAEFEGRMTLNDDYAAHVPVLLTLEDSSGDFEVVKITGLNGTGDGFIIERGQFGSEFGGYTKTWNIGDTVFSDVTQFGLGDLLSFSYGYGTLKRMTGQSGNINLDMYGAGTHFVEVDGSASSGGITFQVDEGGNIGVGDAADNFRGVNRFVIYLTTDGTGSGTASVDFSVDVLWVGSVVNDFDLAQSGTVWRIELERYADDMALLGRWEKFTVTQTAAGSGS